MKENLTKEQKVSVIANSPDLIQAAKMLVVLMQDAEIENFISIKYELGLDSYELLFTKKEMK